jgi:hypothetical protein
MTPASAGSKPELAALGSDSTALALGIRHSF